MIARLVAEHIQQLILDMRPYIPQDGVYFKLYLQAVGLADEITRALSAYFILPDSVKLHQSLVLAAMDFNQHWEDWIAELKSPDLQHAASKVFHEFLLRYSKGMVKAYRIWRIDRLR